MRVIRSGSGEDQQGRIVVPEVTAKLAHRFENFRLDLRGAGRSILREDIDQAGISKFFVFGARSFRDAVGVQHKAITRSKPPCTDYEFLIRKRAKNSAAFRKPVVRAVAMHHHRRVVTGIDVAQIAGGPVELRVEKRDETIALHNAAEKRVESRANNNGREMR